MLMYTMKFYQPPEQHSTANKFINISAWLIFDDDAMSGVSVVAAFNIRQSSWFGDV